MRQRKQIMNGVPVPAMSRMHFRAAAALIKESSASMECRTELAKNMVAVFEKSNPRFDSVKFYQACGV